MLVKDLIKKLEKCNQNAEVYVECNSDPVAQKVVQYTNDYGVAVYVCDNEDYLDDVIIKDDGFKKEII